MGDPPPRIARRARRRASTYRRRLAFDVGSTVGVGGVGWGRGGLGGFGVAFPLDALALADALAVGSGGAPADALAGGGGSG